jgi:hypothetical protein
MATRTLVQILTTALLVAACGPKVAAPSRPARINHLAFFKLKHPEDAQALIAACDSQLATIPGVEAYWCGQHGDFGRTTVDADYDVGFYVGFADADAYEQYVKHPNHQHLVRTWKPRLEWIRVHDVVDETP